VPAPASRNAQAPQHEGGAGAQREYQAKGRSEHVDQALGVQLIEAAQAGCLTDQRQGHGHEEKHDAGSAKTEQPGFALAAEDEDAERQTAEAEGKAEEVEPACHSDQGNARGRERSLAGHFSGGSSGMPDVEGVAAAGGVCIARNSSPGDRIGALPGISDVHAQRGTRLAGSPTRDPPARGRRDSDAQAHQCHRLVERDGHGAGCMREPVARARGQAQHSGMAER